MRKKNIIIACLAFLAIHTGTANGQPVAGMDLTLTCLGGNDYQVRFVYYRDCCCMAAPSSITLQFQCTANPAYNFTITQVPKLPGTGQDLTPACAAMPTTCSTGSNLGYQENVYQAQVSLPPCNQWKVNHVPACHRAISQTIANSTSSNGYIEATLNNLDFPGNSSPVFTVNPIRIMCTGQTHIINHGAIDPDGDSLSYAMVTPFNQSNTTFVQWLPPYSATQPLASNPPVTLDPVTGQIIMTPTMNIMSLMLLKIDQWRTLNGVPTLVGTTYRDIKLNSITCSNQMPVLSGMDTTLSNGYDPGDTIYYRDVCMGDTVSFAIWGHDSDTTNLSPGNRAWFNISWNQGIPQAAFQVFNQGTDQAYALFNWVPKAADRKLHCYTVTIHDLACPYYGVQTYTYCLNVGGMAVSLTPDTTVCQGEWVMFEAVSDPPATDYLWSIDGIPVFTPAPGNTLYVSTSGMPAGLHIISVETYDGNPLSLCTGKANAFLTVLAAPSVFLGNDTNLAPGATILLDAGPGFSSYLWSTGHTGRYCLVDSSGTGLGIKTVWVKVTDINHCTATDTIRITFIHNPGIEDPSAGVDFRIIPNPSDGYPALHLSHFSAGDYDLAIHTRDGRLVYRSMINHNGDSGLIRLNLHPIADGFYYVRITGAGKTATGKLVLQRQIQ